MPQQWRPQREIFLECVAVCIADDGPIQIAVWDTIRMAVWDTVRIAVWDTIRIAVGGTSGDTDGFAVCRSAFPSQHDAVRSVRFI